MKATLSILLGLMLLTSLVGVSYATPMQPTQNTGGVNNACLQQPPNPGQNYANGVDCHAHSGGGNDPHNQCGSISPSGLQVADNHGEFQTFARTCGN